MARRWLNRWSYPQLLLYALVAIVGLGLVIGASTSGAAFGTYTHSWDGTSELRSEANAAGAETIVATDTARYEETTAEGTVGVILASEEAYSTDDAARVADFVRLGYDFGRESTDASPNPTRRVPASTLLELARERLSDGDTDQAIGLAYVAVRSHFATTDRPGWTHWEFYNEAARTSATRSVIRSCRSPSSSSGRCSRRSRSPRPRPTR